MTLLFCLRPVSGYQQPHACKKLTRADLHGQTSTDFRHLSTQALFGQFLHRIVSVSLEGGLINLTYTALRKLLSASLFLYFLEKMGSKLEKKINNKLILTKPSKKKEKTLKENKRIRK